MKPFDDSGIFRPLAGRVRGLAVRGAGVTVLSSGAGLVIQITASAVLARILTPKDFGLVTMVTTFSLLLMNFGLNGFTEAVLQKEEMDDGLASNLFWINAAAGLLLTLAFAASGSLLAHFYHDRLVERVAVGIAPSIFITSLSVLHLALLKRAMCFSSVAINTIVARLASMVVSITLAMAGWGYWALVAGALILPLSQTVMAWIQCRWLPNLPRRAFGTGALVRFAVHVYGAFSVNYFARNLDNLLVGWRFDAQALGFYKKAYDLFALPASQSVSPLTTVAVAALSRFDRRSEQFRRTLLGALSITALLGMGLSADLTLVGKDLIRVLLGPAWGQAGLIFTFFGPGIGFMLVYYTNGWIHLSIGRPERWLRWVLVEFGVTSLLFVIGLRGGPAGVALAWTTSFWILTVPALWYAARPIQLGLKEILGTLWKPVAAAILASGACFEIVRMFQGFSRLTGMEGAMARILVVSLLFGVLYAAAVILFYRGLGPLQQLAALLREMVPWRISGDMERAAPSRGFAGGMAPALEPVAARPLVSILIPAYNAQAWIADAVRSALAQTWPRKEIIVVDDGSGDDTLSIARQFEPYGVRVVSQSNQGASAARNQAFTLCHGDYIQWLDADDLLAPDKIARQMEMLEQCRNKRILASCGYGRFKYRYYRAEFVPTALWCDLSSVEWMVRKLGQNVFMQTATWLVSRELTEAAGPWDTRLLGDDDGEYFCRVLLASDGVRFVPEARVYYRAPWPNSLSHVGLSDKKIEAHWCSMKLHIRYVRSLEDSKRVHAACVKYLQTCLMYFYPERLDIVREAKQLAQEMGGKLRPPRLLWKYEWARVLLGWRTAKHLQIMLPQVKWWFAKIWDHFLFTLENPKLARKGTAQYVAPLASANQLYATESSSTASRS